MAVETSVELQFTVLSSLCKDSNMMTTVSNDIVPRFFTGEKYQFIFKLLKMYNTNYEGVPNNHEMKTMVESYYQSGYGDKNEILQLVDACYNAPVSDTKFVKDSIESFVKRVKFEDILVDLVDKYNTNKDLNIESTIDKIMQAYEYSVTEMDIFDLSNPQDFIRAKRKALGSVDNPKIIKSSIDGINKNLLYKGYKYGDLISVVASPSVGKTTFMINEGCQFLLNGFNVLHLFVGDMTEYSVFLKYMACMTDQPMSLFSNDLEMYEKTLETDPKIRMFNPFSRLNIIAVPPGDLTANQVRTIVDQIQRKTGRHLDVIIVDYADNLAPESDSIYESGGAIYNKLKALAMTNHSVVMTASQPQRHYFDEEILPFDCMAESSKKVHVIDIMIAAGKPTRDADIITLHLAKMREGNTGVLLRLRTRMECSVIKECTIDEYLSRKSELLDPARNSFEA